MVKNKSTKDKKLQVRVSNSLAGRMDFASLQDGFGGNLSAWMRCVIEKYLKRKKKS